VAQAWDETAGQTCRLALRAILRWHGRAVGARRCLASGCADRGSAPWSAVAQLPPSCARHVPLQKGGSIAAALQGGLRPQSRGAPSCCCNRSDQARY
jgi:hypothetical protein